MVVFLTLSVSLYLLTICSVKAQQPILSLNQEYIFDGTKQSVVSLPQLTYVKGNNPRAIKFEMKSNQMESYKYIILIGKFYITLSIIHILITSFKFDLS